MADMTDGRSVFKTSNNFLDELLRPRRIVNSMFGSPKPNSYNYMSGTGPAFDNMGTTYTNGVPDVYSPTPLANGAPTASADTPSNPQNPTTPTDASGWGQANDALDTYSDPNKYLLNWLETLGYKVNRTDLDPFSKRMQDMAGAFPFLYDFSGYANGGKGTGANRMGDFVKDYMASLLNTPAGADQYSTSTLFDRSEMGAILNAILSGSTDGLPSGIDPLALKNFRTGDSQQAAASFFNLLAGLGTTGLTGSALNALMNMLQGSYADYTAHTNIPTTTETADKDNLFWQWLMANGRDIIEQYF